MVTVGFRVRVRIRVGVRVRVKVVGLISTHTCIHGKVVRHTLQCGWPGT